MDTKSSVAILLVVVICAVTLWCYRGFFMQGFRDLVRRSNTTHIPADRPRSPKNGC